MLYISYLDTFLSMSLTLYLNIIAKTIILCRAFFMNYDLGAKIEDNVGREEYVLDSPQIKGSLQLNKPKIMARILQAFILN